MVQVDIQLHPALKAIGFNSLKVQCFQVVGFNINLRPCIKGLDAYGIASVLLYSKPKEALALLASASPARRCRLISG